MLYSSFTTLTMSPGHQRLHSIFRVVVNSQENQGHRSERRLAVRSGVCAVSRDSNWLFIAVPQNHRCVHMKESYGAGFALTC